MKHADSDYIGFGDRNPFFGNRCHLADDYSIAENSPIYATGSGIVEWANDNIPFYGGDDGRVGSALIVRHKTAEGTTFYALYGHIKNRMVSVGDIISSGEQIAEVGRFISDGKNIPHLHFGINTVEPTGVASI